MNQTVAPRAFRRMGPCALVLMALAGGPAAAQSGNLNAVLGGGQDEAAEAAPPAAAEGLAYGFFPESLVAPERAPGAMGGGAPSGAFSGEAPAAGEGPTWVHANNIDVNFVTPLGLPPELMNGAEEILIFATDVDWLSEKTRITAPTGSGEAAGEGFLFKDLPAYAVVLFLPESKSIVAVSATDPERPNRVKVAGETAIVAVVNDQATEEDGIKLGDNRGAFDLILRPYRPQ